MRPVNRVEPQLPASAMKTYEIIQPLSTHFRPATCAEVECGAHVNGWATTVDESTELGGKQAYYIRKQSGRQFSEEKIESGLTRFVFAPGQTCFRQHRMTLEREPIYRVRSGDWRGDPRRGGVFTYRDGDDWVDDFATHQQKLADRLEQG